MSPASTVLMTAVTARVAGCKRVVVCSPRPSPVTLAAAYVADADFLLAIGGALWTQNTSLPTLVGLASAGLCIAAKTKA